MMTTDELMALAKQNVSKARAIQYLIESHSFQQAYMLTTEHHKCTVRTYVDTGDLMLLKAFVKDASSKLLGEMSMRALRELCKKYSIKNYCHLTRTQLITALSGHENERDEK